IVYNQQLCSLNVSLSPFDLIGVRWNSPNGKIAKVRIKNSEEFGYSNGKLDRQVREFGDRIHAARLGIEWKKLENPNFEQTTNTVTDVPNWQVMGNFALQGTRDVAIFREGKSSLKLVGDDSLQQNPGAFLSAPFAPPETGRIFVSFDIGVPDNELTCPLNVVLVAQNQGRPVFRRFACNSVVTPLLDTIPPQKGVRWARIVAPFESLPLCSYEQFRIGFEPVSSGTFWIDNVVLHHVAFSKEETHELLRILNAASVRLTTNRFSDLMEILDGYWAKFLQRNVPLPSTILNSPCNIAATSAPKTGMAFSSQTASKSTNLTTRMTNPNTTGTNSSETNPVVAPTESPGTWTRVKNWFWKP
ncbi:MAG: hypothetical protein ACRCUY_09485, partial [Thermoguttaceae bacterium]